MAETGNKREQKQAEEAKADQTATDANTVTDWEQATEVGYFGTRNNRHDDEEYALTSGPDSPTGERGPE